MTRFDYRLFWIILIDESYRLLVSGKNPASLSKLLRTSSKLQEFFKENQQAECLQILSRFGFAPQRFDSKTVPVGRVCIRLRQAFGAPMKLNKEKRRQAPAHILEELTGDHWGPLHEMTGSCWYGWVHEHARHALETGPTASQ